MSSMVQKRPPKHKKRNYSFEKATRLNWDTMTEIVGIKIPAMPGSCYHAILCALAVCSNKFCPWNRIYELTEKYMCQYGGQAAWDKFKNKDDVKTYQKRIKDNTHTLTRTGKNCYGYRLHEMGMTIYFFKDGAMLLVGGEKIGNDVIFKNSCRIQARYRGSAMTYKEYKTFLDLGYIDCSGNILQPESIKYARLKKETIKNYDRNELIKSDNTLLQVCVTLDDSYDQNTANRLEAGGLVVESIVGNEVIGLLRQDCIDYIKNDPDVTNLEIYSDIS